jgi:putative resolvase
MALRVGKAAKMIGVHPQTLREWDRKGILIAQRVGEQRFYTVAQINEFIKAQPITRRRVIYCRVSSAKQRGDLGRQAEFMKSLFPDYDVIEEVASGVNFHRQEFNKILKSICAGEISHLAVSYKDRLARIGFEMIEFVCVLHGCQIQVAQNAETSPEEEMVEDLIAITTSFSAKIHGSRKYKIIEDT